MLSVNGPIICLLYNYVYKLIDNMQSTLNDKKTLIKRYKLRMATTGGRTVEVSIPLIVIDREMRRLGLDSDRDIQKIAC